MVNSSTAYGHVQHEDVSCFSHYCINVTRSITSGMQWSSDSIYAINLAARPATYVSLPIMTMHHMYHVLFLLFLTIVVLRN